MTTKKKSSDGLTPMMRQYLETREKLPPNCLLFFRLGDFYELFFEDAQEASKILGITLTQRGGTPMAGIPFHAAEGYVNKLLKAGKKVGICDQVEAAQAGKLVKRELTRILTPGTTLEASQVQDKQNHYLLALHFVKEEIHASWLDITTGGFAIASDPKAENLLPILNALDPKEVIVPENSFPKWKENPKLAANWEAFSHFLTCRPITEIQDYLFDSNQGAINVMDSLGVSNLGGFGISASHPALGPASALIHYATENLCAAPANLHKIQEYTASDTLLMDPASMRSLEIFKSTFDNSRNATLMDAIDGTVTAAGSRLLQDYLSAPLMCVKTINFRQDCVQTFFNNSTLSDQIHTHLKQTRDIPRILSRLQNRIQNPRELGAIRETLDQLPGIKTLLNQVAQGNCLNQLLEQIEDFQLLKEELNQALNPTLPQKIQDGGTFAKGYDEELDHLLDLSLDNQSWIASLERSEQERTGIKNLKVKFNNAFGYFIEVTKANTHLVPEDYIRKQTMTNAERYYTESLKEKEKEILHAHDKSIARELFLFNQLIAKILDQAQELRKTATALAQVDLFIGWANIARIWNYCRPSVDNSNTLEIEQGRHAVVEQMLKEQTISTTTPSTFIPNDTFLESSSEQVALITGPNMAGKSTYIRQVALITLMAQIGCFVPADRAVIGLVDRIFSRVGANDELARGNSTFMVEMNETANILNNCTEKSLIILDEIGRGTSTYDGLSIAWAVLEHLHQGEESGPRTLFATHYHELVQLDKILNRLRNYCVSVKEEGDKIVFVRQVIPGTADRSYGIQVAQLAGLPKTVIGRAKTILHELETEGQILISHLHQQKQRKAPKKEAEPTSVPQLSLF